VTDNSMVPFDFQEYQVRVVNIDDEPWFVVNDVCKVLEITNTRNVVERIDSDDVRQTDVTDSLGRSQMTNVVNESGLYEVIFRSDKPEAKVFRKWVTSEVLPQIRKTGSFVKTPQTLLEALELAVIAERARVEAEVKAIAAMEEVKELTPKAEEYDAYINSEGMFTLADTAQLLHSTQGQPIGRTRLIKRLRELEILCKVATGEGPRPRQEYLEEGWFERHPAKVKQTGQIYMQTYVTPEGISGIYKRLKSFGEDVVEPILP